MAGRIAEVDSQRSIVEDDVSQDELLMREEDLDRATAVTIHPGVGSPPGTAGQLCENEPAHFV